MVDESELVVYGDRRCKCGRGMTKKYSDEHFEMCKVCFMKLKRKVHRRAVMAEKKEAKR